MANDAEWRRLVEIALGEAGVTDSRFSTVTRRLDHRAELDSTIARWTIRRPSADLMAKLWRVGLASMLALTLDEHWRDPHFATRKTGQVVDIPFHGPEILIKAPWLFTRFAPEVNQCGPTTGEHNEFVFGDLLGLSVQDIPELVVGGVIA